MKCCSSCKEIKKLEDFYPRGGGRSDYMSRCKVCSNLSSLACYHLRKEHRKKHRRAYFKEYYEANKDREIQRTGNYQKTNREKTRIQRQAYRDKNRVKVRLYNKEYARRFRKSTNNRIAGALRSQINRLLRVLTKCDTTLNLIGCSINALKQWLSYQFEEGMNWNNYGKWHVDHVKPCASFNLEDPEEQKRCFHWTNLQPLWAKDNLIKGAKYEQL